MSREVEMKLKKSTTILFNIVLILVVVLLVKSLIAVPKNVYAKSAIEYKVHRLESRGGNSLYNTLSTYAKEGWTLHSVVFNDTTLIFFR